MQIEIPWLVIIQMIHKSLGFNGKWSSFPHSNAAIPRYPKAIAMPILASDCG
jgi:hypothetical protein